MASTYKEAKDKYAKLGINTDKVIDAVKDIPLSMHCWQGDDVGGFENPDGGLTGGIQATGNYPGKARNPEELRQDIQEALNYIPGKTRLNLHAIYGEFGGKKVDRTEISYDNFKGWVAFCKKNKMGIDFNPTYFSHPLSADGFTLSNANKKIRKFWIDHGIACRKIAEKIGKELNNTVITNFSTKSSRSRSTRSTTATPSSASSSASVPKAMSSARMNSSWATPSKTRPS